MVPATSLLEQRLHALSISIPSAVVCELVATGSSPPPPEIGVLMSRIQHRVELDSDNNASSSAPGGESLASEWRRQFSGCEVLLINTASSTPEARQGLLVVLPTMLSLVAQKCVLIFHGRTRCRPEVYRTANGWAHFEEDCWQARWGELWESGLVTRRGRCTGSSDGVSTWCVAVLPPPTTSLCHYRPPLLEEWSGNSTSAAAYPAGKTRGRRAGSPVHSGPRRLTFGGRVPGGGHDVAKMVALQGRYFSIVEDGEGAVCLLFKDGPTETRMLGVCSRDGLRFPRDAFLVLPSAWHAPSTLTHNTFVYQLPRGSPEGEREYLLVGGKSSLRQLRLQARDTSRAQRGSTRSTPCPTCWGWGDKGTGIWLVRTSRLAFANESDSGGGGRPSLIVGAEHAGAQHACRRIVKQSCYSCAKGAAHGVAQRGFCEYDGRLSLVLFRGEFLLYARANPATHGQRFVMMSASRDLQHWSALAMIDLQSYERKHGEVYFWAVVPNPVHNESLLALAPLVHRFRGCVGLSASRDGRRWSTPEPLFRCAVWGERTDAHPVAGMLRRGDEVHIYMHERVPSIRTDASTPLPTARLLSGGHPSGALPAGAASPARQPAPNRFGARLQRYKVPAQALWRWTVDALVRLG